MKKDKLIFPCRSHSIIGDLQSGSIKMAEKEFSTVDMRRKILVKKDSLQLIGPKIIKRL